MVPTIEGSEQNYRTIYQFIPTNTWRKRKMRLKCLYNCNSSRHLWIRCKYT